MNDIWQLLGIEATANQEHIKTAYSEKLKLYHPEDNPEGFKALQAAYKEAMAYAKGSSGRRATLNQEVTFNVEKAEQDSHMWTVYEDAQTSEKEEIIEKTSYDFSILDDDQEPAQEDKLEEAFQDPTYSALNQELEEDLESKEAECQQSSFEKTFEDWGVEFEEDSEEPGSWAELAEQFRLAEEVEDLVDELSNRLGLMFSFQTFNLTLEHFNQHPLFTNEEVKRGLEEHCLNAFILGKWTDRMEAVRRSRELGLATLATYLEKVGLSEQEMKIGKDTRLEGWQER